MTYLAQNSFRELDDLVDPNAFFGDMLMRGETLNAEIEFEKYKKACPFDSESDSNVNLEHFQDYFEMLELAHQDLDFYDVSIRFNGYEDKKEVVFRVGVDKNIDDPEKTAGYYAVHKVAYHKKYYVFCYKILSVTKVKK